MYIVPVILSGGRGQRLWPLSTSVGGKAGLRLPNGTTLYENALKRAHRLAGDHPVISISGMGQLSTIVESTRRPAHREQDYLIFEEAPLDTAFALATCLALIESTMTDDVMIVMLPADHLIDDNDAFVCSMLAAADAAQEGLPVVLGVVPQEPSSQFGYIEAKGNRVTAFREKPNLADALVLWQSPGWYWNSGYLCARARALTTLLEQHAREHLVAARYAVQKAKRSTETGPGRIFIQSDQRVDVNPISVDYLLLEKIADLGFAKATFGMKDVGTWRSIEEIEIRWGNLAGDELAFCEDSADCSVFAASRPVVTYGVENLLIVDTEEAVLVADRLNPDGIRKAVARVEAACAGREPRHEARPWGTFTVLDRGEGYKVKRLEVTPTGSLSLQSHRHRDEKWMITNGTAIAEIEGCRMPLGPGSTVDIKAGQRHRLSNEGFETLIVIELQTGQYLGEDDQIRYEDKYGRV